jgi:hypothetical protein
MNKLLLSLPIAVSAILLNFESAIAQTSSQFFCGMNKGNSATLVRTENGKEVAIINWITNAFVDAGWDNQKRCETVSERFEKYKQLGELNFLTTGQIGTENVICVSRGVNKDCSWDLEEKGLLLTVRPGVNPKTTLKELLLVRASAGKVLSESSAPREYVNVQCLVSAGDNSTAYQKCAEGSPLLSSPPKVKPTVNNVPKPSGSLF